MERMSDDPNFTGSSSSYVPKEVVRITMPVVVHISEVHNYTNGKITNTHYDWYVDFRGERIAYRDIYKKPPRTRKSALTQAKRALKNYSDYLATRIED